MIQGEPKRPARATEGSLPEAQARPAAATTPQPVLAPPPPHQHRGPHARPGSLPPSCPDPAGGGGAAEAQRKGARRRQGCALLRRRRLQPGASPPRIPLYCTEPGAAPRRRLAAAQRLRVAAPAAQIISLKKTPTQRSEKPHRMCAPPRRPASPQKKGALSFRDFGARAARDDSLDSPSKRPSRRPMTDQSALMLLARPLPSPQPQN